VAAFSKDCWRRSSRLLVVRSPRVLSRARRWSPRPASLDEAAFRSCCWVSCPRSPPALGHGIGELGPRVVLHRSGTGGRARVGRCRTGELGDRRRRDRDVAAEPAPTLGGVGRLALSLARLKLLEGLALGVVDVGDVLVGQRGEGLGARRGRVAEAGHLGVVVLGALDQRCGLRRRLTTLRVDRSKLGGKLRVGDLAGSGGQRCDPRASPRGHRAGPCSAGRPSGCSAASSAGPASAGRSAAWSAAPGSRAAGPASGDAS
jgi:hypothetical protein